MLIRTYERGVEDLTYACGTGTASVALVLKRKGLVSADETVTAKVHGGSLSVDVKGNELWLYGPTNIVAIGDIKDEELIF